MKTKRLATLMFVSIVSIFLITSGLSIAFNGGSQVEPLNSDTENIDDRDTDVLDDDDDDYETEEDDDDEERGYHHEKREREEDDDYLEWDELIGHEEAIDIAFEHANGTIMEFKLEDDDDSFIYKLEIINDTRDFEIEIDAYTGEVLKFEADEHDDDDDEPEWDELIGHERALEIAFDHFNGTVIELELEDDDDNFSYEIEIVNETKEFEVEINAYTGEVLELEEEHERERERERERDRGIGRFWNGTEGTYVSFELLENGIKNYTLHINNTELLLFRSVTVEGLVRDETESEKVFYEIEGNETEIKIFDVAPALMKMEVESDEYENRTVSFDLGDLQVVDQHGPNLVLSYENYTAKLLSVTRGDGWKDSLNMDIENGTVNYTFEDELFLVFRMTDDCYEHEIEHEREREMEENVSNGISEGKVGGEVVVDKDGEKFSDISVSYSDMKMDTKVRERNRIQVKVSSDTLKEGKVVAVNVYRRVLNIDNIEDIEVTFDGEEISMADDYKDLTDTDDGAEYLVSVGSDRVQVLVMVPHFSTHTIEIAKSDIGAGILGSIQYQLPLAIAAVIGIVATVWIVKKKS